MVDSSATSHGALKLTAKPRTKRQTGQELQIFLLIED